MPSVVAIATSTLRRTVAGLLGEREGLSLARNASGKLVLLDQGEITLTRWMTDHMRVAWQVIERPWELEDALIKTGPRLPLDLSP